MDMKKVLFIICVVAVGCSSVDDTSYFLGNEKKPRVKDIRIDTSKHFWLTEGDPPGSDGYYDSSLTGVDCLRMIRNVKITQEAVEHLKQLHDKGK